MEFSLSLMLLVFSFFYEADAGSTTKHYIVYMGNHFHPTEGAVIDSNHAILSSVVGSLEGARRVVLHHYSKSFRGFSASLTPEQARTLSEHEGVVSVFESEMYRVHTSHSWDFLGINRDIFGKGSNFKAQGNVIIGHIDTGIWPESKSFSDAGMGHVPKRFKGQCVVGDNFTLESCNRKVIGARYYYKGFEAHIGRLESFGETFYRSARDADGHGTHTASAAAGSFVDEASFMGLARGTVRGGAPGARLAIYKACWFGWCSGVDLLAAFDDAISDGVDIITVSAAPSPPQPSIFEDSFSIGGFHAFLRGILVCAAAGNSGKPSSATNVAPWIFTIAASSIDRRFESDLLLGNQVVLKGDSLTPVGLDEFHELIEGSHAAAPGVPTANASYCMLDSLDPKLVAGKIVLCTIDTKGQSGGRMRKSISVKRSGGVGMVLLDPIFKDLGIPYVIPTTVLGQKQYQQVLQYMATQKKPIARIQSPATILSIKPAPQIAAFSSMGPSTMIPDIIKPDITAPGLNILAAWSPVAPPGAGLTSVDFNIISGTSMSCPHVSGAAAMVKSLHPSWGPAAIKSAMMTTATLRDNTGGLILRQPQGNPATPFDYGSGHLNPISALEPGLVYEFDSENLIDLLCGTDATQFQLQYLVGEQINCTNRTIAAHNLNYPSIAVAELRGTASVYRTLTNYGTSGSVYEATIEPLTGVNATVTPDKIKFTRSGQKLSYTLQFTVQTPSNGNYVFSYLTWSDGKHTVRSPIAVNAVSV